MQGPGSVLGAPRGAWPLGRLRSWLGLALVARSSRSPERLAIGVDIVGRGMIENWQLAGFWGPRGESAEECACRWLRFFRQLEALGSEALGAWGLRAGSRNAVRELVLERANLATVVQKGRTRDYEKTGFVFGAWNRKDVPRAVGFNAICGASTSVVLNVAYLTLHSASAEDVREWTGLAGGMMGALVEAWEPDWGFFVTDPLRDQQQDRDPRAPVAGYLTYLWRGRSEAVPRDLDARIDVTSEAGSLISLLAPDGSLPPAERVLRLASTLRESGAFAPTPLDRPLL